MNSLKLWKSPEFILNSVVSVTFFLLSLIINNITSIYSTKISGPSIPDIILDNIPLLDLSFIHYRLFYFVFILIVFILIFQANYLNFSLKTLSVLVLVRSFFVCLTHLGIPDGTFVNSTFFTSGGDLFFSGHVAVTFLFCLIFWRKKSLRYLFVFICFVSTVEVLFGKFHYSIDVFAAPFFAYTVYDICKSRWFFKKDYEIIN